MYAIYYVFVIPSLWIGQCQCSHFFGMTLSTKPNGAEETVDITHTSSWGLSTFYCNDTTIRSGTLIFVYGELKCKSGCTGTVGDIYIRCTDYNTNQGYMTGSNTITKVFNTAADNFYQFGYFNGYWRTLVQGSSLNWHIKASANFSVRQDTGSINNSPVAALPAVISIQTTCNHTVKILVSGIGICGTHICTQLPVCSNCNKCNKKCHTCTSDTEGDRIKCRFAQSSKEECGGICNPPTGFNLDEDTCIITYTPSASAVGWYGIAVQVEDFYPGTNIVLSSMPLQLLYNVLNVSTCGINPLLINPTPSDGSCIPFSGQYTQNLVAAQHPTGLAVSAIGTVSPQGMTKTSLANYQGSSTNKFVTVSWTPSTKQSGPTIYCFYAADTVGLMSSIRCVTLVKRPSVATKSPADAALQTNNIWILEFDSEFSAPNVSTYIKFYKADGTLVKEVDVTDSSVATYPSTITGRKLIITASFPIVSLQDYYILIDEGVASTAYCGGTVVSEAVTNVNFWRFTGDINECANETTNDCAGLIHCVNEPGNYSCVCAAGYRGDGYKCTDIDECATNTHNCSQYADCTNYIGGFSCSCITGYEGDGYTCKDINECAKEATNDCGGLIHCVNKPGNYSCVCAAGYSGDGYNCTDINECANETTNDCAGLIHCVNVLENYTCVCAAGYSGDGYKCTDIDECATNTHNCSQYADCTNYIGGFSCSCISGYEGDGYTCIDINECAKETTNDCGGLIHCVNVPGNYSCVCAAGYIGDGYNCTDINECAKETSNDCGDLIHCVNVPGNYSCVCAAGYSGDGYNCTDIDECATNTHTCSQYADCTNYVGAFNCSCITGYEGDGYTCIDINECANETTNDCAGLIHCVNVPGNYSCVCASGYSGNGYNCTAKQGQNNWVVPVATLVPLTALGITVTIVYSCWRKTRVAPKLP